MNIFNNPLIVQYYHCGLSSNSYYVRMRSLSTYCLIWLLLLSKATSSSELNNMSFESDVIKESQRRTRSILNYTEFCIVAGSVTRNAT